MFVEIGGIRQWIEFAEPSGDRPILLYLHGGPGASSRHAAAAWSDWETHFAVVHWDQRGAGRTYAENGEEGCGALTIDRMVEDALEVVEFLRDRLKREKILLVGHSWGSVLAVHLIKRRPDLFWAYVGTGQVVNSRRNEEVNYRRQLAQALRKGDTDAHRALVEMGPPPYDDRAAIVTLRELADRLADGAGDAVSPMPRPINPQFTVTDRESLMSGLQFSRRQLFRELTELDLPSLGLRFDIPMFFFEGTEDQQTPAELAQAYFDDICAPHKEYVRFEGCHHFVVFNRPDDFLRELVARVLPWARPSGALDDDDAIERLALRMIDRSLPKREWTHAGHFALALWLLRKRPELTTPEQIGALIRRYNEATDTPNTDAAGYHHTITLASMRAAAAHLRDHAPDAPLHAVLRSLMSSALGRSDWPLAYWRRDTLFGVAARRGWVEPDIAELPF